MLLLFLSMAIHLFLFNTVRFHTEYASFEDRIITQKDNKTRKIFLGLSNAFDTIDNSTLRYRGIDSTIQHYITFI